MGGDGLLIFVFASVVLCIMPGPDMIYLVARSIGNGKKAGVYAALGINLGAYVHLIAAICGLSVLLATSSVAFLIIKYLGAAYLTYIGLKMIFKRNNAIVISLNVRTEHKNLREIFWQGFISDVLNPKVALFYLAFLPQFVHEQANGVTTQLLLLGITLNCIGITVNLIIVYLCTYISRGLRGNARFNKYLGKMMGTVFVGLGIRLAAEKS